MKKHYLLLIPIIAVTVSCNKEAVTKEKLSVQSFSTAKPLYGKERATMISSISKDQLFQDYLASLVDIQNTYTAQLNKIKNFDAEKLKAEKPKNENEYISSYKNAGFSDPELLVKKYKQAKDKLAKLYEKYPNFSNSMSDEEKKAFFKEETLKFVK